MDIFYFDLRIQAGSGGYAFGQNACIRLRTDRMKFQIALHARLAGEHGMECIGTRLANANCAFSAASLAAAGRIQLQSGANLRLQKRFARRNFKAYLFIDKMYDGHLVTAPYILIFIITSAAKTCNGISSDSSFGNPTKCIKMPDKVIQYVRFTCCANCVILDIRNPIRGGTIHDYYR